MGICCRNQYISIIGNVSVDATNLVITPTTPIASLQNEDKLTIVVTNGVTSAGMTLPVLIQIGDSQIPIYDRFGNIVYGASLRTDTVIQGYYGVNGSGGTEHIQVVNQPFLQRCR